MSSGLVFFVLAVGLLKSLCIHSSKDTFAAHDYSLLNDDDDNDEHDDVIMLMESALLYVVYSNIYYIYLGNNWVGCLFVLCVKLL